MAAVYITKTAKDGNVSPLPFNRAMQDKDGTGASIGDVTALRDSSGNDIDPAKDQSVQSLVTATGTVADTAYASGSGTVVSVLKGIFGKVSGALGISAAASALSDGSDVTQGLKADAPYAGSGAATVVSVLKGIYAAITAALPSGSNIIGKVGIDQTAGQNVVVVASASAALPTTETYTHSLMTGGVAVASGVSSLICAARAGRKEATVILEAATTAIRLRSTNDASATVGARLPGVDGEALTISGGDAVYGAGITAGTTVSVIEVW